MNSATVIEKCPLCGKPSKMRIEILGKVNEVPVKCDCKIEEGVQIDFKGNYE